MTRRDEAQMLTVEATIATLILISAALFLTQFTPVDTVDRGDGLSRVQLQRYGQDIMTMITTKNIVPEIGYKLRLYREWNSTEDDGVKWGWEENGTEDGIVYPGTSVDVTDPVYSGVDEKWTDAHLVINHTASENATVWFVLKPRGASIRAPSGSGDLNRLTPFQSGSKVETLSVDRFVFNSSLYGSREYGASMAWFSDEGDVTNPIVIWQDETPDNHDRDVKINETATTGGEIFSYWQMVQFDQHNSIVVDVLDGSDTKFHVIGPGLGDKGITVSDGTTAGVTITKIGDVNATHQQFEVTFEEPALGGYSLHWGSGSSFQWSDPVFVVVGKTATIKRQISPFDNILQPLELNYFEREFVPFMEDVTPRNMEYRFVVYRLREGGGQQVVYNSEGDRLALNENVTPVDPVVINRYIASGNGTRSDVYNARLTLWYR